MRYPVGHYCSVRHMSARGKSPVCRPRPGASKPRLKAFRCVKLRPAASHCVPLCLTTSHCVPLCPTASHCVPPPRPIAFHNVPQRPRASRPHPTESLPPTPTIASLPCPDISHSVLQRPNLGQDSDRHPTLLIYLMEPPNAPRYAAGAPRYAAGAPDRRRHRTDRSDRSGAGCGGGDICISTPSARQTTYAGNAEQIELGLAAWLGSNRDADSSGWRGNGGDNGGQELKDVRFC